MRTTRLALVIALVLGPAGAAAQAAAAGGNAPTDLPEAFVRRSTRKGGGKFFRKADIDRVHAADTPHLLARVSGGDLRDVGNGDYALVNRRGIRQTFSAPVENELCRIGVMVNERLVPDGFDLKSVSVDEIVAIEFYSGPATVPPDLNTNGADASRCGLIVVWSKGG